MSSPIIQSSATSTPGQRPPTQMLNMPFKIDAADKVDNYLNLLIYGSYGTGKTTLAVTALEVPEMNDVLMISAESGDQSVAGETALKLDGVQGTLDCTKLDLIKITDFEMLARVADYLKEHCKLRDANNEAQLRIMEARLRGCSPEEIVRPRKYKTVIIDTLTEIDTYCMYRLLGISDDYKLDSDIMNTDFSHYKKNNMMMLRVIRAFRDLPMYTITTCAEEFSQDETKKMKFQPYLTGKLSSQVQAYMDMVGYMQASTNGSTGLPERVLHVVPPSTKSYDAKHRYPKFKGKNFATPTMKQILTQTGLLKAG